MLLPGVNELSDCDPVTPHGVIDPGLIWIQLNHGWKRQET